MASVSKKILLVHLDIFRRYSDESHVYKKKTYCNKEDLIEDYEASRRQGFTWYMPFMKIQPDQSMDFDQLHEKNLFLVKKTKEDPFIGYCEATSKLYEHVNFYFDNYFAFANSFVIEVNAEPDDDEAEPDADKDEPLALGTGTLKRDTELEASDRSKKPIQCFKPRAVRKTLRAFLHIFRIKRTS